MDTTASASPPVAKVDVDLLVAHIKRLRELGLHIRPRRDAYGHMGATIADAALQAGWDYPRFVQPRVTRVLAALEGKPTTTDFLDLLDREGAEAALDVRGRKPRVARRLARLLQAEGVETEAQLRDWIVEGGSREKLIALKGVSDAGIGDTGYDDAAAIVRATARELGTTPASLEGAIWRYQRRAKDR